MSMPDTLTFIETYIRMMDVNRDKEYQGQFNCNGVCCASCNLGDCCPTANGGKLPKPFEIADTIVRWGREHPVLGPSAQ